MTTFKDEILKQVSVFASDFAEASTDKKASDFAESTSDKTPDRQDDGSVGSRRDAATSVYNCYLIDTSFAIVR